MTTSKDATEKKLVKGESGKGSRLLAHDPCHELAVKHEMEKYEKLSDPESPWYHEFDLKKFRLNRPKKIRIDWGMRSNQNKIFLVVYRILRFINVTVWTYFLPTIALVL